MDDYEFKQFLGEGSFGKVLLVTSKSNKIDYAMKISVKSMNGNGMSRQLLAERNVSFFSFYVAF